MRAGKLNRRITFQEATETVSGTGSISLAWVDVATVWAGFEDYIDSGRETFDSQKEGAVFRKKIRIRYYPGLSNQWRIKYTDTGTSPATTRYYEIESIGNPSEGRREQLMECIEKPDGDPIR